MRAYQAGSFAIGHTSTRISEPVARALFLSGYLGWAAKRRIVEANVAHLLGLPAGDPAVKRLARRTYSSYARFALELMRLPWRPVDEPLRQLPPVGPAHDAFTELWDQCRTDGRGIIVASGHIGSIEIFAGSYALQGVPTWGLADDTAYPELFALLNAQRARWGVGIIPWRNMREVFRVLRKSAVLGMVVDWGYRSEDVPVRLFGAWTTLPAGPATLAARTHAANPPRRRAQAAQWPVSRGHRCAHRARRRFAAFTGHRDPGHRRRPGVLRTRCTRAVAYVQAYVACHGRRSQAAGTACPGDAGRSRSGTTGARRSRVTVPTTAAAPVASRGGTLRQRIAGRALIAGVWLLQRLPDKPVYRLAHLLGRGLSYLMRERRALARANLGRVCRALDASGLATPDVRAAARNGRRLDAMVRDVFGYWIVTYVETAMAPRYGAAALRSRIRLTDPAMTSLALGPVPAGDPGPVFVGLHLGAAELAALYAARLGQLPVAGPMEQVSDPVMRDYFDRTRRALGFEVLPIKGVAPLLVDRIIRGEAVAIVADRVIGGRGTRVALFGAPARLPAGPAMLAIDTGAPLYALAILRSGAGAWVGHMERVPVPAEGTRRERLHATLEAQVRTFERFIAVAPDQWWTLLFRIWEEDAVA